MPTEHHPQVKICGLTRPDQAAACADLGADAIGLIFYPKSPRHVSDDVAADIVRALPDHVPSVGVFVNESFETIMRKVNHCGLKAVQLHGREAPDLLDRLQNEDIIVIKALFSGKSPSLDDAGQYAECASAFLTECGKGKLPGGNAMTWNWAEARKVGDVRPLILAGGLSADNVAEAVRQGTPDAVDVSSGVESAAGVKDMEMVAAFIGNVRACASERAVRNIFRKIRHDKLS